MEDFLKIAFKYEVEFYTDNNDVKLTQSEIDIITETLVENEQLSEIINNIITDKLLEMGKL